MKGKPARKRLDLVLVERKLAESREKAAAMILAGEVRVDGKREDKAGMPVAGDAKIEVASRHPKYVSRGGFKLEGALMLVRRMAASRIACCSTARRGSTPWTSTSNNSIGSCDRTRA